MNLPTAGEGTLTKLHLQVHFSGNCLGSFVGDVTQHLTTTAYGTVFNFACSFKVQLPVTGTLLWWREHEVTGDMTPIVRNQRRRETEAALLPLSPRDPSKGLIDPPHPQSELVFLLSFTCARNSLTEPHICLPSKSRSHQVDSLY